MTKPSRWSQCSRTQSTRARAPGAGQESLSVMFEGVVTLLEHHQQRALIDSNRWCPLLGGSDCPHAPCRVMEDVMVSPKLAIETF